MISWDKASSSNILVKKYEEKAVSSDSWNSKDLRGGMENLTVHFMYTDMSYVCVHTHKHTCVHVAVYLAGTHLCVHI
jgi:hypothetical protein